MDPADSSAIPRATPYSGTHAQPHNPFTYGTNTHYGAAFKQLRLKSQDRTHAGPTTPNPKGARFRLLPFRSPLLRESIFLSIPSGTKMFQFPEFPPTTYEFSCRRRSNTPPGSPIRTPPDQSSLPAPRGLSQVTTSFIGSTAKASTTRP